MELLRDLDVLEKMFLTRSASVHGERPASLEAVLRAHVLLHATLCMSGIVTHRARCIIEREGTETVEAQADSFLRDEPY